MEFDDVILGRRSIRGYKPDPVPRALIEEIIGLAMRAPSCRSPGSTASGRSASPSSCSLRWG
jgi:nitroreductase